MKVAYFDPFSGASGDMVLGAMVDAGMSLDHLLAELAKIPISGYQVQSEHVEMNAVRGIQVRVSVHEPQPARNWPDIQLLIEHSSLDTASKLRALAIFEALAVW